MKIAVQLYSVRDHIQNGEDLLRVLGEVKALGYEGVEFALGYFGLSAPVLRARLDELGLQAVGTHADILSLEPEDIEETLDFHEAIGCRDVGIGGSAYDIEDTCELLQQANEAAEKRGMRVYYHNHSGEFKPSEDGERAIDAFLANCWLELDTYWSFHAGVDNYAFITEHADKIIHLHLKDGVDGVPCALGEGNCDLATVVKAAEDIGLEWLIVENDDPIPNGLADVGRSIQYLKKLLV